MDVNYAKAVKYAVYSKEVYQDFNSITFGGLAEKPNLINEASTDTQCALLTEGNALTIAFRGSSSDTDWKTDFESQTERVKFDQNVIQEDIVGKQQKVYPYEAGSESGAEMHQGFVRAYFSVRPKIHDYLKSHDIASVTVTGHSLGGALAILCAVDIQYNFASKVPLIEVYTYGAPKVGNDAFRDSFNRRVPNSYRFVHGMDLVPELPRWWQGYRQVEKEFRIGQRFSLNFITQRFKDHAIDKYIEVLKTLAC
ncbi:MAG: lipase family protein [Leptolyngbya sp. BL-A-14]